MKVHIRHCCKVHGCKYGEEDCPVTNEIVVQHSLCERCKEERRQENLYSAIQDKVRMNTQEQKEKEFNQKKRIGLVVISIIAGLLAAKLVVSLMS